VSRGRFHNREGEAPAEPLRQSTPQSNSTQQTPRPTDVDLRKGCIVRLVETEGRRKTTILRFFRTPTAARQVDFQGQTINQLHLEGDGVRVDVRPYEVCDVEVIW
jgi:hypothetical protein